MPEPTPASGDASRGTPEVQKYRPRACQSCARSKMRCVWPSEPGATPCQRCSKIQAPCTLPEINPRRRRGPSTRVGQLEEKIDGIMSLLNASQQIQQNSPDSGGQTPPSTATGGATSFEQSRNSIHQLLNPNVESNSSAANISITDAAEAVSTPPPSSNFQSHARFLPPAGLVPPASIATGPIPSPGPGSGSKLSAGSPNHASERDTRPTAAGEAVDVVKGFRVSFYEADRALNLFRSIYSPYFPFVVIPVMTTSFDLYDKSPFLFRTIVAVTTPQSPAIQAEFKLWFREYVAQHVVVNNERRLEILQAILIYLAWGDFYFMVDSQATNLIQLANAMVIDLGLNRWPIDYGKANYLMFKEGSISPKGRTPWKRKHTPDEMRAALGAFYTASLCSTMFRRHGPMTLNPYLVKSCEALALLDEYDSDKFLVALVKIQQLLNRVADIIPYGDDEAARSVQYAPIHMAITAAQKELEAVVRQQPPEVECNTLLWTHYYGTLCRLFEPALHIRLSTPSPDRTRALWTCLNAARDFFTSYTAIPPHNFPCMPFHSAHLSFCIVTTVRLLYPSDPSTDLDWTHSVARESTAFEGILDRLGNFFDEADRSCAGGQRRARYIDQDRSVLSVYREKLRWIREWCAVRARPDARQFSHGARQEQPFYRPEDTDGGVRAGNGENVGAAMEVEYSNGAQPQEQVLDEGFWEALFDWSWSGNGGMADYGMEVQAGA
ncbi:hypothetical protein N0V93_004548 [Gnomoniopsis smithogilvyi]|uniref:Zn(2)-C6 fungal-type domain-containing protein n=1 Tax=Gnomoniopsis smithogilvyi TaxID=1191159 RepID=A0A9W9CX89_9PEZI|nr:hypothetical protein N0V93_004548 [Gnomoniopsis smithogilvyi]